MTSLTRGPLSPAVYWRRRVFALGLVAALVFVVSGVVRGGDGPEQDAVANQASATTGGSASGPGDPTRPGLDASEDESDAGRDQDKKGRKGKRAHQAEPPEPVLATPDGPCLDGDVRVTPSVSNAIAGRPVRISLDLQTGLDEACTWKLSPQRLALRVSSGSDEIWNSAECGREITRRSVTVRRAQPTTIEVEWDARRSADGCPQATDWARAGYYYVAAAALGGEPAESQFRLSNPEPEVITKGGGSKKQKHPAAGDRQSGGAHEPDGTDRRTQKNKTKSKQRNAG